MSPLGGSSDFYHTDLDMSLFSFLITFCILQGCYIHSPSFSSPSSQSLTRSLDDLHCLLIRELPTHSDALSFVVVSARVVRCCRVARHFIPFMIRVYIFRVISILQAFQTGLSLLIRCMHASIFVDVNCLDRRPRLLHRGQAGILSSQGRLVLILLSARRNSKQKKKNPRSYLISPSLLCMRTRQKVTPGSSLATGSDSRSSQSAMHWIDAVCIRSPEVIPQ